jgi:2-iminoacetate synthase ThiH
VNGDIHEFSDINLIVIKDSQKGFYERLKGVGLLVMPELGADILVYTIYTTTPAGKFMLTVFGAIYVLSANERI